MKRAMVCLVLLGLCSGAWAADAGLRVWPVDPLVKVLRSHTLPESPRQAIFIEACRGEVENGQAAFRFAADVAKLSATATPLVSDAGKTLCTPRVRFPGYIHLETNTSPHLQETGPQTLVAKAPVDIPDPLLEDDSIPAAAGQTGSVWLTVPVAADAQPGLYRGRLVVNADGAEHPVFIAVKVHPARLPPRSELKIVNWYFPVVLTHTYRTKWWTPKHWQLIEADARIMAAHRLTVGHIILNETIRAVEDANGRVSFDFTHFDRLAATWRDAGLPWLIGSALAGRHVWHSKDFYAIPLKLTRVDGSTAQFPAPEDPKSKDEAKKRVHVSTPAFERYLAAFLPVFQKHLEEKGWLASYIQHQADEPVGTNAAAYIRLGQLVRKYAPKLRRAEAVRTTRIVGGLDIWAPLLNELDRHIAFYRERQKAGDEVWFYTCERPRGRYMNRQIDYPLIKTRLLHWANFATATTGYLHWGYNPSWGNPFKNPGKVPGDAHLVYPGIARLRGLPESADKLHSLDSLRYEAMRDGIEDYDLLRLLAAKAPEKAETLSRKIVRSLTDYTLAPEEFNAGRRELLEGVSGLQ